MKKYISENIQSYILFSVWIALGIIADPLAYIMVPISILLLYRKQKFTEIILGFFLILILSDNRDIQFNFAINTKIFYLLTMLIILLTEKQYKFNNIFIAFIPFFLFSFYSLYYSPDIFRATQKTFSYILLALVIPYFTMLAYNNDKNHFFRKLVFFSLFILLIGIIIKLISPSFTTLAGRYRGMLGNPNGLGIFCDLTFLLFSLISHLRPTLFSRSEKIFAYILILFSVVLSGSRTALLAIIVFILVKTIHRYSAILSLIASLTILLIYNFIINNLGTIIKALGLQEYLRTDTIESGSGRLIAWQFAWANIQKSFFVGKGFAFTEHLYIENYATLSILGHQGNAHNSYLTIWLNTGIIGLILFFSALFYLFFKGSKNSYLAFPILYPILISINFESWLAASLNPFTIILFIIITILVTKQFWQEQEELIIQ